MKFVGPLTSGIAGRHCNTGRTDRRTDGPTDLRTDTTSYKDATAHLKKLKRKEKKNQD